MPGWGWLPPVPPPEPALASGALGGVASPSPSTMPPPPLLLPVPPELPEPLLPEDPATEPLLPPDEPPSVPATAQLPGLEAQSATPIWVLALV